MTRGSAFAVVVCAALALVGPAMAAETAASGQLAPEIVRDIQRSLNAKGYQAGSVDGRFGAGTRSALQAFQQDHGLPGSGRIDQRTLAALGVTGVAGATGSAQAVPPGQTLAPEMVANVQKELQRLGYAPGRTDGVWGDRTRQALMEFQRDRRMPATGRIDRETLAAIEAGGVTQTGELPR